MKTSTDCDVTARRTLHHLPGLTALFLALPLVALVNVARAAETAPFNDIDCLIEANQTSQVSTSEIGIVETILVDRGQLVVARQPVARLESSVEQAAVALLRSQANSTVELEDARVGYEFANRKLRRAEELSESNSISEFNRDEAVTEARRALLLVRQVEHDRSIDRLELARAQARLDRRTIRSSFNGVVVERLLEAGESVEDRPILEIAQVDPLNVEIIVPVDLFGRINVGDAAMVAPEFPGAQAQEAKVVIVDRVVDAASNTFGVRLNLANPDNRVPAGVRCSIEFLVPSP